MESSEKNRDADSEQQEKSQEFCDKKTERKKTSSALLARTLLDVIEITPSIFGVGLNLNALFHRGSSLNKNQESYATPSSKEEYKKNLEEKKIDIIRQLLESDIDPQLFDILVQNEVDRRLKVRFGVVFLVLTFLFTTSSYAIVILDGILKWNISNVAITALIIETPIQFIGLLYIIARNLFPQGDSKIGSTRASKKNTGVPESE